MRLTGQTIVGRKGSERGGRRATTNGESRATGKRSRRLTAAREKRHRALLPAGEVMDDAPEHESPRRARFLRPQHRPERVADFFLCEVRARERDDDVFLFDEVRPQRRPVRVKARRELLRRRPRVVVDRPGAEEARVRRVVSDRRRKRGRKKQKTFRRVARKKKELTQAVPVHRVRQLGELLVRLSERVAEDVHARLHERVHDLVLDLEVFLQALVVARPVVLRGGGGEGGEGS